MITADDLATGAEYLIYGVIATGTQAETATLYANMIDYHVNWHAINEAILQRWPDGLATVKTRAWEIHNV